MDAIDTISGRIVSQVQINKKTVTQLCYLYYCHLACMHACTLPHSVYLSNSYQEKALTNASRIVIDRILPPEMSVAWEQNLFWLAHLQQNSYCSNIWWHGDILTKNRLQWEFYKVDIVQKCVQFIKKLSALPWFIIISCSNKSLILQSSKKLYRFFSTFIFTFIYTIIPVKQ